MAPDDGEHVSADLFSGPRGPDLARWRETDRAAGLEGQGTAPIIHAETAGVTRRATWTVATEAVEPVDDVSSAAEPAVGPPPTPVEAPPKARSRRRQVPSGQRAEWVLHRVRVWSVAKVAFCVYLFLYAVVLGAAALLWWLASSDGVVHNVEKFFRDVGFTDFHFHGNQLMQGVALGGAVAVLALTMLTALAMAVVNVISELSGGLRLVITEDRPRVRRGERRRRRGDT